jgi:hypothetical protein
VSGAITATTTAADLEEPIPVPSGYGFKLNPDSTNLEHKYDSGRLPPQQAEVAAGEVVDYYVNRLSPEWTLVSRQEPPLPLEVELRQGDTSRGISISVSVVTPQGRPAVLVLSIRTLLCGEDLPVPEPSPGGCMAAPVSKLVRYPGGGPVPVAEPSTGPLREPVPLPPGYEFALVAGISDEQAHAYVSTTSMSDAEADRGQRAVMRYYRHALNDWTIVETDEAKLVVKGPDSTSGLEIDARTGVWVMGGRVELEIRSSIARKTTRAPGLLLASLHAPGRPRAGSPPRAAPRPHAPRLRACRPDWRILGLPREPCLRRTLDRLRGGSDAASGARRDAAGGGLSPRRTASRVV